MRWIERTILNLDKLSQTVYYIPVSQNFFKKWANLGLFCLFSFFSRYNFNTNWKKRRWCAWDSNPRPQDGRHSRKPWSYSGHPISLNFTRRNALNLTWLVIISQRRVKSASGFTLRNRKYLFLIKRFALTDASWKKLIRGTKFI